MSNCYSEKSKKDLFINFFYVNNEVILALNQNIKWLRRQTRGSAYPCIEFLLIGLKDINKLQDSVIKFSSLQLIRKQLLELKKEYEYNKDLTKGLTTRESEETLLKAKQEYDSSKLKYDEIFVSLPSHPNDRERILELFVDRNNNIITKDKLRIRPEFDNYALDMYNIMTSVLNEEKAKK